MARATRKKMLDLARDLMKMIIDQNDNRLYPNEVIAFIMLPL